MIAFTPGRRIVAVAGAAALLAGLGIAGTTGPVRAAAASPAIAADGRGSCHLSNGIKHVVQLTFDNVHFFRDNPNVPSDLEQMPNLLNFFEDNGTFLSNDHTPLIAHTADDILTIYSGLYGALACPPGADARVTSRVAVRAADSGQWPGGSDASTG